MDKNSVGFSINFVKNNMVYVVSYCVFVKILVYFIPAGIREYNDTSEKIESLDSEIERMALSKRNRDGYNVGLLIEISKRLDMAIPEKEDYFSIFHAIERLAMQSGVTIVQHSSPFNSTEDGTVSIDIKLMGDLKDMMRFLDNIHFKSGRFLTVDNIQYNPEDLVINCSVKFHSAQVSDAKVSKALTVKSDIPTPDKNYIHSLSEEVSHAPLTTSGVAGMLSSDNYAPRVDPFAR